jgi:hypothetical protein
MTTPDTLGQDTLEDLQRDVQDSRTSVLVVKEHVYKNFERRGLHADFLVPALRSRKSGATVRSYSDQGDLFVRTDPKASWKRIEVTQIRKWRERKFPYDPTIIGPEKRFPSEARVNPDTFESEVRATGPGDVAAIYLVSADFRRYGLVRPADQFQDFQHFSYRDRTKGRDRKSWRIDAEKIEWGEFLPEDFEDLYYALDEMVRVYS